MANTVDNKKDSSIDASDFNAIGMARPIEGVDSTADIKDKLAKKIGYKGSAMPPFMMRPFKEFRALQKKRQQVKKDKLIP